MTWGGRRCCTTVSGTSRARYRRRETREPRLVRAPSSRTTSTSRTLLTASAPDLEGVAGQGERGWLHWGAREGTERDGEGGSRGGGDLEQQTGGRGCTCSQSVSWFGVGKGLPQVRGGWRDLENLHSCLRDNAAVHFGYNILYIKGI
jgi:hypothetical protein